MIMKKLLLLSTILFLGISVLSSCNKTDGGNGIVGTWKCVYSSEGYAVSSVGKEWTFEAGGTLLWDGYPVGQYRYDNQTRILKYLGSGECYVHSVTATRLRLGASENPDEHYSEFERVK